MYIKSLDDKKQFVDIFKKSYKKWYHDHTTEELDIRNEELVLYFIRKSYIDMMPRTLKKLNPTAKISSNAKEQLFQWLKQEFLNYFKFDVIENFNEWHKNLCLNFVDKFNNEVIKDNYMPIHFGKAQKIVNMNFKYLSTCDNADEYEEYFKYCHIPIDSYILKWYYREISPKTKACEKIPWSNLSYDDYFAIQSKINSYFEQYGKNPFIEEWSIWETEKSK